MPTSGLDMMDQEIQRLMQADWGDVTVAGAPLADIDRIVRLYGVVEDPYHRVAFAGRSNLALMLICARGLLEDRQWDKAARVVARIHRMERDEQTAERVTRSDLPDPAAAPAATPAPQAAADLGTLSDRELWLKLKAARRDRQRARAGRTPVPKPVPDDRSPLAPRAANGGPSRPPFT